MPDNVNLLPYCFKEFRVKREGWDAYCQGSNWVMNIDFKSDMYDVIVLGVGPVFVLF